MAMNYYKTQLNIINNCLIEIRKTLIYNFYRMKIQIKSSDTEVSELS